MGKIKVFNIILVLYEIYWTIKNIANMIIKMKNIILSF